MNFNKVLKSIFIIFSLSLSTVCFARQLSNDDAIYYKNLRNCNPGVYNLIQIYGATNNKCKVAMTMPNPPGSKAPAIVYTYKYPMNILNSIVNDALNMSEEAFKKKWEPREHEFCTSIKYGDKEIYSQ